MRLGVLISVVTFGCAAPRLEFEGPVPLPEPGGAGIVDAGSGAVGAGPAVRDALTARAASFVGLGTVELYGFAPLRSWGTTTIRGFEADVDTSLTELIPTIETVGSARASLENLQGDHLHDLQHAADLLAEQLALSHTLAGRC